MRRPKGKFSAAARKKLRAAARHRPRRKDGRFRKSKAPSTKKRKRKKRAKKRPHARRGRFTTADLLLLALLAKKRRKGKKGKGRKKRLRAAAGAFSFLTPEFVARHRPVTPEPPRAMRPRTLLSGGHRSAKSARKAARKERVKLALRRRAIGL